MKKIIIIAYLCFGTFSAVAQQVALSEVAELKIPIDGKSINRQKLYADDKVSRNSIIAQSGDRENLYEIGSILIKVIPLGGPVDKSTFKDLEYDHRQIKNASSFFNLTNPSINGATAVCAQYEIKGATRGEYFFIAVNSTYTKQLSILIEYDIADRDKADKIFSKILKSIKMKG